MPATNRSGIPAKRRRATKAAYPQVAKLKALNSKPNKSKEDVKQLEKLNKQAKHEKQKMDNTGENHSRKAKGSN